MNKWAAIVIAAAVALGAAFYAGRRSVPAKTVTQTQWETQVVYRDLVVEHEVRSEARAVNRRVVERRETRPDGSSVVERTSDTVMGEWVDSVAARAEQATASAHDSGARTVTVERVRPALRLTAGPEWSARDLRLMPGLRVGVEWQPFSSLPIEVYARAVAPEITSPLSRLDAQVGAQIVLSVP